VAKPVVCVVGAGTAGLEGLLCAHEVLGAKVELRLIAPEREFRYRPMSAGSLFRPAEERGVAIADLVAHAGATWVGDRAGVVREAERQLLTRAGDTVDFDFLLLAPGSRSKRSLRQGSVWERGSDPGFFDEIILGILAGDVRSVAVAVPRGARWPLPAYELALVLAWSGARTDVRVTLITAEQRPLGALGSAATDLVARELESARVEVIAGVEVVDDPDARPSALGPAGVILVPEDPGSETEVLTGKPTEPKREPDAADLPIGRPSDPARIRVGAGPTSAFDRLISLPTVVGPLIGGIPTDAAGFIEVDETLKVCGSERVWAAGSCIAAALEHSALAARQADAAVAAIAAAAGFGSTSSSGAPELTGMLLAEQRDQWLAENPAHTRQPSTRCLWWPPGRAVGSMLAGRIAAWDPSVNHALPNHRGGLPIRVPVGLGCSERPYVSTGGEVSPAVRMARLRDIENRQLMALQREARAADDELRGLSARLEAMTAHQQEVVRDLQQHGYLRDHARAPGT
jgi:sulfide:quinone oxidoreductase